MKTRNVPFPSMSLAGTLLNCEQKRREQSAKTCALQLLSAMIRPLI